MVSVNIGPIYSEDMRTLLFFETLKKIERAITSLELWPSLFPTAGPLGRVGYISKGWSRPKGEPTIFTIRISGEDLEECKTIAKKLHDELPEMNIDILAPQRIFSASGNPS